MKTLVPELALVRPRVRGTGLDSPRLLVEVVEEHAEEFPADILWLIGSDGAGKTTALAHLAAVFVGDPRFAFLDDADNLGSDADCESYCSLSENALVVAARHRLIATGHRCLQLEPWTADELVEYLLAKHRAECGAVMERMGSDARRRWTPELARMVLDQLAEDRELPDARNAAITHLHALLPDESQFVAARQLCLHYQKTSSSSSLDSLPKAIRSLSQQVKKLLRHELVQVPLAAEQIVTALLSKRRPRVLEAQLPLALVEAVAQECRCRADLLQKVEKMLTAPGHSQSHAMAASILFAADRAWRPRGEGIEWDFSGAYFSGVNWPEVSLANAHLQLAEFFEANLASACFDKAILVETDFVAATLQGASLQGALAVGADFERANLRYANLDDAKLESASLVGADLKGADLRRTNLCQADLSGASFIGANLSEAVLVGATLADVDFSKCEMTRIDARRADFRTTTLDGACLELAWLNNANFEDVVWNRPRLRKAGLRHAHFTGSRLRDADLRGADLKEAGLGEIDWENADLSEANLSGATFHMGSSRSGMVDSPIACEGSRTAFYTHDLEELYFKSPEDVRKANLRGADLRGADVSHVDFYLVDLRDAKLDLQQYRQAQRTGAILTGSG